MFSWHRIHRTPIVIAHRGARSTAPENTLAAFRQALDAGADAIELDVQMTRDGEVVVFHDSTLDRTTDGRGRLCDQTLAELKRLSAGLWFNRKFSSERIPTLAEVFDLIGGKIGIDVEIKVVGVRRGYSEEIVDKCIDLIHLSGCKSSILVSSFRREFLLRAKELNPSIATGFLYHPMKQFGRSPSTLARTVRAEFFFCNHSSLRQRMIRDAHMHNLRVGIYTINSESGLHRFIRAGVDCVFTDYPHEIVQLLH